MALVSAQLFPAGERQRRGRGVSEEQDGRAGEGCRDVQRAGTEGWGCAGQRGEAAGALEGEWDGQGGRQEPHLPGEKAEHRPISAS